MADVGREFKPDVAFYLIMATLVVITLLAALESTSLSLALPTISTALNGTAIETFWAAISFLIASTALLPVLASLSGTFGRKPVLIFALFCFTIGSVVSALARSMATLLAGRTVQGIGGIGLICIPEMITADILPLRQRALWFGILNLAWAVGSVCGPLVGGAFAQAGTCALLITEISTNVLLGAWRWIFWINLVLFPVALLMILFFLKLNDVPRPTLKLWCQIDWFGAFLFIPSFVSFLVPLSWGGVMYPWFSWRVLVPLILGLFGMLAFIAHEMRGTKSPLMNLRIFNTSTLWITCLGGYLHGVILWSLLYYLPLYYETVKEFGIMKSALAFLPETLAVSPMAAIAGALVAVTGHYRGAIWIGWITTAVGLGLLQLLNRETSTPSWILINLVVGIGTGVLFTGQGIASQAGQTVKDDTATSLYFFTFFRTFGQATGVAISGAIFQNQIRAKLRADFMLSSDADVYAERVLSLTEIIRNLDDTSPQKLGLIAAYNAALQVVWIVMCVFSVVAFIGSLFMKSYVMGTTLDDSAAQPVHTSTKSESKVTLTREDEEASIQSFDFENM